MPCHAMPFCWPNALLAIRDDDVPSTVSTLIFFVSNQQPKTSHVEVMHLRARTSSVSTMNGNAMDKKIVMMVRMKSHFCVVSV